MHARRASQVTIWSSQRASQTWLPWFLWPQKSRHCVQQRGWATQKCQACRWAADPITMKLTVYSKIKLLSCAAHIASPWASSLLTVPAMASGRVCLAAITQPRLAASSWPPSCFVSLPGGREKDLHHSHTSAVACTATSSLCSLKLCLQGTWQLADSPSAKIVIPSSHKMTQPSASARWLSATQSC